LSDDAKSLIAEHESLWNEQANWRSLWDVIAQYVLPAWDDFIGHYSEGIIRTTRIFDGTAISANERFAAWIEQLLTPRTQMWHDLTPADEDLVDDPETQAYCQKVRKILFAARYRPAANYASQTGECYLGLGAFGNSAMLVDEVRGKNLLYRSIPLHEIVWSLNAAGMVDSVYRVFEYTAKQCMERWPDKCPDVVEKAYRKAPFTVFEILHAVKPNNSHVPGAIGPKGMAYGSWYIFAEHKYMIEEGGYRSFPYAISRYRMAPREHYGRSPASVALPSIRTLNEMKKTALRAGQKAVDPPLLLTDEGALTQFNLRSGALNYGALSSDGTPLVQPLESKGRFDIGKELMELEATSINDSFLVSLFQILAQEPNMTATEALIRAQEKGILIAPTMGRQQSEFLAPTIIREIDILHHAGLLPPPPMQLLRSGQGLKIEYTSPLSKLMRAEEAKTIMEGVQGLAQFASVKPQILDLVDWDQTGRDFLEASGFPSNLLLDPEALMELRQQNAQAAQAQQMAQVAPGVSQSALNLAKAQQALGGGGGGSPGASPSPAPTAAPPP
jgi:hypothetical protein